MIGTEVQCIPIGMAPAAMYSTTLMPKCSSIMEWIPATAPPKSLTKSLQFKKKKIQKNQLLNEGKHLGNLVTDYKTPNQVIDMAQASIAAHTKANIKITTNDRVKKGI